MIQSPDTDVVLLCGSLYRNINCKELWFRTGVKDNLRYNPTHTVSDALGQPVCDALPGYHAITGCDSVSSLFGIWKKKSFDALLASEQHQASLTQLEKISIPTADTVKACERYICSLYTNAEKTGTKRKDSLLHPTHCCTILQEPTSRPMCGQDRLTKINNG